MSQGRVLRGRDRDEYPEAIQSCDLPPMPRRIHPNPSDAGCSARGWGTLPVSALPFSKRKYAAPGDRLSEAEDQVHRQRSSRGKQLRKVARKVTLHYDRVSLGKDPKEV